jgi:hypothetical protein
LLKNYSRHGKKKVCNPRNVLVINVCNQGKTLCSPCTFDNVSVDSSVRWKGLYVFHKFTETLSTCPCSVWLTYSFHAQSVDTGSRSYTHWNRRTKILQVTNSVKAELETTFRTCYVSIKIDVGNDH